MYNVVKLQEGLASHPMQEVMGPVAQPGFYPGGASGREFPQNIADGKKSPNLLELNNTVNN